jgi:hypothetical protein
MLNQILDNSLYFNGCLYRTQVIRMAVFNLFGNGFFDKSDP